MIDDLPRTITIAKAIPTRVGDATLGGGSYIDGDHWYLHLGIADSTGHRDLHLSRGDTAVFAGTTWQVTHLREPTTATRGLVATLTRVELLFASVRTLVPTDTGSKDTTYPAGTTGAIVDVPTEDPNGHYFIDVGTNPSTYDSITLQRHEFEVTNLHPSA